MIYSKSLLKHFDQQRQQHQEHQRGQLRHLRRPGRFHLHPVPEECDGDLRRLAEAERGRPGQAGADAVDVAVRAVQAVVG